MEQSNEIEMLEDDTSTIQEKINNTTPINNGENNSNKKDNKIIKIAIIIAIVAVIIIAIIVVLVSLNKNKTYKITYMSNDSVVDVIELKKGEKLKRPVTPNIEGYIFNGWMLDNNTIDFDTYLVEKDITLTASFIRNESVEIKDDNIEDPEEEHDYMDSPPEEDILDEDIEEEEIDE